MAVTIKDIAKKSGFSVSTVSRALTDDPHILDATKRKIMKIAKSMNYKRDFNASTLVTGSSRSVGVIFPSSSRYQTNPFYLKIISGINEELSKRGFVITIALAEETKNILKIVKTMAEQAKVSKFIFLYHEPNDPIKKYLDEEGLSYVTVGNVPDAKGVFIDNDNYYFGKLAGEKIFETGYVDKILFVRSVKELRFEEERLEGLQSVVNKRASIYPLKVDLVHDTIGSSKIIESIKDIDIIVAAQDELAEYMYDVLLYRQIRLPIITFNNLLPSYRKQKNIYSFDLNPEEIGRVSAQKLFILTDFKSRDITLVK